MHKYVRNYIIQLCLCSIVLFTFSRCSPQKRLNRLISNHPELGKTDTVFSSTAVDIPGYRLDTTFKASQDLTGLDGIIDSYRDYLDSVRRTQLRHQVGSFILNRPCLEDTFRISLNNYGWCKIWQQSGTFYYELNQPAYKKHVTVPVSVQRFDVIQQNNWKMFWIGFAVAVVALFIISNIGHWIK